MLYGMLLTLSPVHTAADRVILLLSAKTLRVIQYARMKIRGPLNEVKSIKDKDTVNIMVLLTNPRLNLSITQHFAVKLTAIFLESQRKSLVCILWTN